MEHQHILCLYRWELHHQGKPKLLWGRVYVPTEDRMYTIDPQGRDETNTINRAELAGILSALRDIIPLQQTTHIFSDSLCSLLQINKFLLQPAQLRFHNHKEMVQEIANILIKRAEVGGETYLHKVKGHSGITGNDKADEAAEQARRNVTGGQPTDSHTGDIEASPREQMAWAYHDNGMALSDLKGELRHVARKWDPRPQQGLYHKLHQTNEENWGTNAMKYLFGRIPLNDYIHIVKYLSGTTYNDRIKARNNRNPNWRNTPCAICGGLEGATHALGGCQHPEMKAAYIARHNKAVQTLAKALGRSQNPNIRRATYIMDGGTPKEDAAYLGNRLPDWMLNQEDRGDQNYHRPDILAFIPEDEDTPPLDVKDMQTTDPELIQHIRAHYRLLLIEVGYGGDYRLQEKLEDKAEQHITLLDKLTSAGWKGTGRAGQVTVLTVAVGVAGRFLSTTHLQLLDHMTLSTYDAQFLIEKLGLIAANKFRSIQRGKQELEKKKLRSAVT